MQIVIDIPEELKNKIDNANEDNYKTYLWWFETTLYCALKNGTPLPKGHGRIGDLDALAHKMCIANIDNLESEEVAGLMLWYCDKADTIIEADTESEVPDAK